MNQLTKYGIRGTSKFHFNRAKQLALIEQIFSNMSFPIYRDLGGVYQQMKHQELSRGLDRLLAEKGVKKEAQQ